jgi:ATP-dependent RNA helicase DDX24/MAK5
MLIGPEDVINFKKIYKTLQKDEDIPLFPVQSKYMDVVKVKVKLHCTASSQSTLL